MMGRLTDFAVSTPSSLPLFGTFYYVKLLSLETSVFKL